MKFVCGLVARFALTLAYFEISGTYKWTATSFVYEITKKY